jgi:anti-sigma regulatory factor (Ser/Thr protein kinase)
MMNFEFKVNGGDFTGAGNASSQLKKVLKQLGVDPVIIKRAVIALYEAEVNIVAHARKGIIRIHIANDFVKINLDDEGPGIEDIGKAMEKGFSTASEKVRSMGFGAGMGLPNIKTNADNFKISSQPGVGTHLEIIVQFR